MNWSIVQLEMVNILLAVRLFQAHWAGKKVLIKCDNEAVVSVLRSGKTRDPYLGACARNFGMSVHWLILIYSMCMLRGWTTGWQTCCPVEQVVAKIALN